MIRRLLPVTTAALLAALPAAAEPWTPPEPLVVAHRGASGYLPEHTLPAKAMAHGQGAHCIEQDVVLTADGAPVVLHDTTLDATTDVAGVFPGRARPDGKHYAIDFTLEEIRRLTVTERRNPRTGEARYPERFPVGQGTFRVPTLAEEIALVQGLNASTGRTACLYVEIKDPAFHREEGQDLSRVVLDTLAAHGLATPGAPVILQTFDHQELKRLRQDLGWQGRLVQLLGENRWGPAPGTDFDHLKTPAGLAEIAAVADGIGPWVNQVLDEAGRPTGLVAAARDAGLAVHAYTVRADALPDFAADMPTLLEALRAAGVTGVFTDFPDIAVQAFGAGD